MERDTTKTFSGQLKALVEANTDFLSKLKQRLVSESSKVENPFKFIVELFNEGVLCDGSNDLEAHFGFKEMLVQLAVTIGCSKGADGIGGLVKALKSSGNLELLSALQTWAKEDLGIETDNEGVPSEPKEDDSAGNTRNSEVLANQPTNANERSSCGTKLVDKIMSRLEDDFMEQLEGHLVSKAAEIVNVPEICSSLVRQKVLDENDILLAAGREIQDRQQIEKVIKATCLNRTIGSLVVAFQKSNNERILTETYEWLETSQARKKYYPISVKSLARQPRPTATGLFAATFTGLISLDLHTLKATTLTSGYTRAVAVNHKLKKVYWSEIIKSSRIMRSNFDGSAKEVIVPQTGDEIYMLAVNEASGNVYFALFLSHEIKVCSAVGKNCTVVLSSSSLVKYPVDIALDSENGFMYWTNRFLYPSSIVRANLDGSNATIISTGFTDLAGITLGQSSNGLLYWVDYEENTIGTVDVNGGNKQTLAELEGYPALYGIQADAYKIYFGSNDGRNIQSMGRCCGKELTTIFKSTAPVYHLALFNAPATQP